VGKGPWIVDSTAPAAHCGTTVTEAAVSDLYDADFVLWSERQADLLRRMAAGERVNDLDWANLVEEVEGLGKSEISAARSLLLRALEHFLKAAAWPGAPSVRKWLHDAQVFLDDAEDAWTPSMVNRIDIEAVYARALGRVEGLEFEDGPLAPLPKQCPVALADVIGGDARALAGRFSLLGTGA
jgi:hypothetical protein